MSPEHEFIQTVQQAHLMAINRHKSKGETFDLLLSRLLLASDTYYAHTHNETKGIRTHPT